MKKLALRLWRDEAGYVVSTEAVLVSAIVLMGLITGLTTFRNEIASELADAGAAIGSINQTYSYGAVTSHNSSVAGSTFVDALDFCEDGTGTRVPLAPVEPASTWRPVVRPPLLVDFI